MNRKRILSLLLVFLLLTSLTACNDPDSSVTDKPQESLQTDNTPPEQELDPNKETLIYAKMSLDQGIYSLNRATIDQFNKSHTDVQIEVKDYWDSSAANPVENARDRLMADLSVGAVPDIIDLSYLPYRRLAKNGYLQDLWPYLDSDPELSREDLLTAPLEAAEINGGLYALFGMVNVETLLGSVSQVGDRTSWTLEDLQAAFAAMPEDSTILEYTADRESIAAALLQMSIDDYVDWESGTCSFDDPNFRAALEFLNFFLPRAEVGSAASFEELNAMVLEADERLLNGWQLLEQTRSFSSLSYLLSANARHGGQCAYIGYPMADGSVGSCFHPTGERLAMSATCKNKEAAWDYIRTVLKPTYAPGTSEVYLYRPFYEMDRNRLMRDGQYAIVVMGQAGVEVPPATEEDLQRYERFFNSIEKIDLNDSALSELVLEICQPYFAGDKSIDETIQLLNNRIGLYVNEQK